MMKSTSRRAFVVASAATAASLNVRAQATGGDSLSNRTHIFAPPEDRERLSACLSDVLGCGTPMSLNAPGLSQPMLAFRFPGGGSLSVEFTVEALGEKQMRHGAWLEIRTSDVTALQHKVLAAGFEQIQYGPTNTFYFALPGGQVMGIVPAVNASAGEMRAVPKP